MRGPAASAFVLALAVAVPAGAQPGIAPGTAEPAPLPVGPSGPVTFRPPASDTIPDTPLGSMIRFGRLVFVDTQRYARDYVGNGLNCVDCHLDDGRRANAAPLWAAYVAYPAFRSKDNLVNTFERRLEGCFRYSMNGRMPPADSAVIVGLVAYSFWLATGAPVGAQMAGRGYPVVATAPLAPSAARGAQDYATHCAACHGPDGAGLRAAGKYTFPPLWGKDSYNAGAGMHRVPTAAAFIKANMPLGAEGSLTDQQAWDLAAYMNSRPRPPDPRTKPTSKR